MDVIGLVGERVRLVPSEPSLHLENALRWLNDPEVTARLDQNVGVTRRQEELFFEHVGTKRDADLQWAIVSESLGHVGFTALHQIDWRNRQAAGGIFLGEKVAWGLGIATEAVRIRTRFAFEQLGLHRIDGHTFNPAMRRVYEKAGYTYEGTARQARWRDGRWNDVYRYAILDADYFARPINESVKT